MATLRERGGGQLIGVCAPGIFHHWVNFSVNMESHQDNKALKSIVKAQLMERDAIYVQSTAYFG